MPVAQEAVVPVGEGAHGRLCRLVEIATTVGAVATVYLHLFTMYSKCYEDKAHKIRTSCN